MCVCGPDQRVDVDMWIEEHLEGSVALDAQLVVFVDEDLGEERRIAQPPVGVVAPGVDVGAVRLHEAVLLAFEPVTVGGEAFQFLCFGGHEPVELVMESAARIGDARFGLPAGTPGHVGDWRASQWPDASCLRRGAVGFVPGGCSTHSTVTRWSVRWAGSVPPGQRCQGEFLRPAAEQRPEPTAVATREELRIAIVTWIQRTDHRRRRQQRLGTLTPIEDETTLRPAVIQAA